MWKFTKVSLFCVWGENWKKVKVFHHFSKGYFHLIWEIKKSLARIRDWLNIILGIFSKSTRGIFSTSAIEFLNYWGVRMLFLSLYFDPNHSWLIRKKMSFQVAFIRVTAVHFPPPQFHSRVHDVLKMWNRISSGAHAGCWFSNKNKCNKFVWWIRKRNYLM